MNLLQAQAGSKGGWRYPPDRSIAQLVFVIRIQWIVIYLLQAQAGSKGGSRYPPDRSIAQLVFLILIQWIVIY